MLNVLVLSDFDSRIKWGMAAALKMTSADHVCLVMQESQKTKVGAYVRQIGKIVYSNPLPYLRRFSPADYDVVICALGGWMNLKVISFLQRNIIDKKTRPLLVGGVNGLIDRNDPDVVLSRVGYDLLLLNNKNDGRFFRETFSEFEVEPPAIVETGYLRIHAQPGVKKDGRNSILFAQQDGVPASKKAYIYMLERLLDFAEKDNSNKIVIKFRDSGSHGINSGTLRYSALGLARQALRRRPHMDNVEISACDFEQLLGECDEVWSISSTALMEGLMMGKKVFCLSDFGISKKNGNTPFVGSKLFIGLNNMHARGEIRLNPEWKVGNIPEVIADDVLRKHVEEAIERMRADAGRFKPHFYMNSPWLEMPECLSYFERVKAAIKKLMS
jgi:hypothetical protein